MTKSLFAVLLSAIALPGCAHLPGVAAPAPVLESKVYRAPHAAVQPQMAGNNPGYVEHRAVPVAASAATLLVAAAAPIGEGPGYVEVTEVPTSAFKAIRTPDAAGATFLPAHAAPTWELSAKGPAIVSKAKLEVADATGTYTATFEASAKELGLPGAIKGKQLVKLELAQPEIVRFVADHPDAKQLLLRATLEGPGGEALTDRDGKPVQLVLPLEAQ